MPIRVMIVDSHELSRAGIKITINERADLELVAEASSLDEALQAACHTPIDVAILDPEVGCDRFDAIHQFQQAWPDLKVLVLSSEDCGNYATSITSAGASGYLIKAASLDEIAVAIRSVHNGRVFISHTHQAVSAPKLGTTDRPAANSDEPGRALSRREQEVLLFLADGLTNKQVAERLFLSIKTIETYRSRIMRKHGLRDRAELVRFARLHLGAAV